MVRFTNHIRMAARMVAAIMAASLLHGSSASAATDYYPAYNLSSQTTNQNYDIAFVIIAVGLIILAIDSLFYLAHFAWRRRPSLQRRARAWSQDQS